MILALFLFATVTDGTLINNRAYVHFGSGTESIIPTVSIGVRPMGGRLIFCQTVDGDGEVAGMTEPLPRSMGEVLLEGVAYPRKGCKGTASEPSVDQKRFMQPQKRWSISA